MSHTRGLACDTHTHTHTGMRNTHTHMNTHTHTQCDLQRSTLKLVRGLIFSFGEIDGFMDQALLI